MYSCHKIEWGSNKTWCLKTLGTKVYEVFLYLVFSLELEKALAHVLHLPLCKTGHIQTQQNLGMFS